MQVEAIRYDRHGRMMYHPKFHPNHGKQFTQSDLEYLCKYYDCDHKQSLAFALGKTEHTIRSKVNQLKKCGLFDYYKNLNRYW
jgi:hypothetical protein